MSTATDTAVTTSVVVDVPQARAFTVFTDEIGTWWDPDHHLLPEGTTLERMVFEPRVGGHVYDVVSDGSECRWSRVLAYDPPERVGAPALARLEHGAGQRLGPDGVLARPPRVDAGGEDLEGPVGGGVDDDRLLYGCAHASSSAARLNPARAWSQKWSK